MNEFSINGRKIGPEHEPYIIAELSANHNGSLKTVYELIDQAVEAGADAIKIQTYTPDTLTIKCDHEDFLIKGGLWDGKTLYDLYGEAYTPWEWHKDIFDYAKKVNITLFSTPFDETAVDFLEELNTPAYKVASFELIDLQLIEYIAKKGKPMILSTGMANFEEIQDAVKTAHNAGCKDIAILRCVSGYPASPEDYNLKTITDMIKNFENPIGLSDHTLENTTAIASVALGVSIIEKHFTLDRKGGGPDDSFSLEPSGLKDLCEKSKTVWKALGKVNYDLKDSEKNNLVFRRSLYFVNDLKAGSIIDKDSIRSIRPGYGLAPKKLNDILGKKVKQDVHFGQAVKEDLIDL